MSTTSARTPPRANQRRPVQAAATRMPIRMHTVEARIGIGPACSVSCGGLGRNVGLTGPDRHRADLSRRADDVPPSVSCTNRRRYDHQVRLDQARRRSGQIRQSRSGSWNQSSTSSSRANLHLCRRSAKIAAPPARVDSSPRSWRALCPSTRARALHNVLASSRLSIYTRVEIQRVSVTQPLIGNPTSAHKQPRDRAADSHATLTAIADPALGKCPATPGMKRQIPLTTRRA